MSREHYLPLWALSRPASLSRCKTVNWLSVRSSSTRALQSARIDLSPSRKKWLIFTDAFVSATTLSYTATAFVMMETATASCAFVNKSSAGITIFALTTFTAKLSLTFGRVFGLSFSTASMKSSVPADPKTLHRQARQRLAATGALATSGQTRELLPRQS